MNKKNPIILLNEHLYGNCQQYCKLSAVASLGMDFRFIMANDMFYFAEDESLSFPIRPTIKQILSDEALFEIIGVKQEIISGENIVVAIEEALDDDKYIMVCVDCYNYPSYAKCYKKKHRYHYFLIYGYDSVNKVFFTIEPWGFTMQTPLLQSIGYTELKDNVDLAKKTFNLSFFVSAFSKCSNINNSNFEDFYCNINYNHYNWLLDNYKRTSEKIQPSFYNAVMEFGANDIKQFHGFLDRFVRHKQSQAYAIDKILYNREVVQAYDAIIKRYMSCVNETDMLARNNIFPSIYELEVYAKKTSYILKENIDTEISILLQIKDLVNV